MEEVVKFRLNGKPVALTVDGIRALLSVLGTTRADRDEVRLRGGNVRGMYRPG